MLQYWKREGDQVDHFCHIGQHFQPCLHTVIKISISPKSATDTLENHKSVKKM